MTLTCLLGRRVTAYGDDDIQLASEGVNFHRNMRLTKLIAHDGRNSSVLSSCIELVYRLTDESNASTPSHLRLLSLPLLRERIVDIALFALRVVELVAVVLRQVQSVAYAED
jgi:hypothetical protein